MIQENETIAKKITNETDTLPYANSNSMEKDNSMEKAHPNVINIDKAIIVSDLHLGYGKCNATAFTDFLEDCISNGASKEYSLFIMVNFGIFGENMTSSTRKSLTKFCH
jgi:hypothetical protein